LVVDGLPLPEDGPSSAELKDLVLKPLEKMANQYSDFEVRIHNIVVPWRGGWPWPTAIPQWLRIPGLLQGRQARRAAPGMTVESNACI
jgi:hypothetical protein